MILVTGATGNVGRALARVLSAEGVEHRVMVRDRARLDRCANAADVVVADWDEPATLIRAFHGVEAAFLMFPGIGGDHVAASLNAARAAGVKKLVLLSSFNVIGDPMPAMGKWHHDREQLVAASGVPFTVLRPSGYMTNAFEWLQTMREGGYVLDPIGPGRVALVDPEDIAAAAAVVLTREGHDGERYALTGDEAMTVAEQVALLTCVVGRPIELREVESAEEAVRFRYPNGAPPALAEALLEGLTRMRADRLGFRTDTLFELLGRRPRTFSDWCKRNAEPFRAALDESLAPRK